MMINITRVFIKFSFVAFLVMFIVFNRSYANTPTIVDFIGTIEDKDENKIHDVLVFIYTPGNEFPTIAKANNGFFSVSLLPGEYTVMFVKNNKVLSLGEIKIGTGLPQKKNFVIADNPFEQDKTSIKDFLKSGFWLGLFSGILSGVAVGSLMWFIKTKLEMKWANKHYFYLSAIMLQEVDTFFKILSNSVHEKSTRYDEILKERLFYLDVFADKLMSNLNWLMQKMHIKKSSLIFEIKPIVREWLEALETGETSAELIRDYFANRKKETKYQKVMQLENRFIDYKRKLISAR